MYNTGVLYRDGIGVDKDEKSTLEWSATNTSFISAFKLVWLWQVPEGGCGRLRSGNARARQRDRARSPRGRQGRDQSHGLVREQHDCHMVCCCGVDAGFVYLDSGTARRPSSTTPRACSCSASACASAWASNRTTRPPRLSACCRCFLCCGLLMRYTLLAAVMHCQSQARRCARVARCPASAHGARMDLSLPLSNRMSRQIDPYPLPPLCCCVSSFPLHSSVAAASPH